MIVKLEWDEVKRRFNLRKHNIDFADLDDFFDGDRFTFEDQRQNYGEIRLVSFGFLNDRVIAVVYVERGKAMRIISARKTSKNEEIYFYTQMGY